MKIAVLGGAGYIGSYLVQRLQQRAQVTAVTRAQVDLLDRDAVKQYLAQHNFDVVIGAAKHASWELADRPDIASHNLTMFTNIVAARDYFGSYINLGSGAEFDRTLNMDRVQEQDLFNHQPLDGYGLSRNIISRLCQALPNFYTIRLWGIFGAAEPSTRLFNLVRGLQSVGELTIKDCLFDYISMTDLGTLVEYYCINYDKDVPYKDINAVYVDKFKLTDQLQMMADIHGLKSNWKIAEQAGLDYTGSGARLDSMDLDLQGLKLSLLKEYQ